jgi:hypothetical protein
MALFVGLRLSSFSCICSNFKRWCWSDRSNTSSVLVVRWHAVCPVTFPHLSLVALLVASLGNLSVVTSGLRWPPVAPVESPTLVERTSEAREELAPMMPSADGVSKGTASVEVDGASPQLSDEARGLLRDLVKQGADIDVPGSPTLGDAAPAPGSSGIVSPGVSGLPLLGSLGFSPPPRRCVGDEADSAGS